MATEDTPIEKTRPVIVDGVTIMVGEDVPDEQAAAFYRAAIAGVPDVSAEEQERDRLDDEKLKKKRNSF